LSHKQEATAGGLIFFELAVLMRWLLIGLLVSVVALVCVAGAVARHVWRQKRAQAEEIPGLEAVTIDGQAKPEDRKPEDLKQNDRG